MAVEKANTPPLGAPCGLCLPVRGETPGKGKDAGSNAALEKKKKKKKKKKKTKKKKKNIPRLRKKLVSWRLWPWRKSHMEQPGVVMTFAVST